MDVLVRVLCLKERHFLTRDYHSTTGCFSSGCFSSHRTFPLQLKSGISFWHRIVPEKGKCWQSWHRPASLALSAAPGVDHLAVPVWGRGPASVLGWGGWCGTLENHGCGSWGSPAPSDFGRKQWCPPDCSPMVLFIWSIIRLKIPLWDLASQQSFILCCSFFIWRLQYKTLRGWGFFFSLEDVVFTFYH